MNRHFCICYLCYCNTLLFAKWILLQGCKSRKCMKLFAVNGFRNFGRSVATLGYLASQHLVSCESMCTKFIKMIKQEAWSLTFYLKYPISAFCLSNGVFALWHDLHRPASSFIHNKVSGSYIARTVWPRLTKSRNQDITDIRINLLYSHTGYDVTSYFRSEVNLKKTVKNATSDDFEWIFWEQLEWESPNYTYLLGIISVIKLPDMMLWCY